MSHCSILFYCKVEKQQEEVILMHEKIYDLVNKLKNLDTEKLSMIEEATDNCLAVQTLERIRSERLQKNICDLAINQH